MFLVGKFEVQAIFLKISSRIGLLEEDDVLAMQDQAGTHVGANRTGAEDQPVQSCCQDTDPSEFSPVSWLLRVSTAHWRVFEL